MFGEGRVDAAAPHFDLGKLALAHARANEADTDGEVVAKRLRWLTGGPPHTLCVPLAVARARAAGAPRKVIRLTIGEEGRPGVAAAHLCAWVELMTALAEMPGDDGERLEFIVPQDGGDVCGPRLALRRAWPHVLAALEALVAPDSARHYCDIVLRNMATTTRQLRPRLDALVAAPRATPCEVAVHIERVDFYSRYIMTCNYQFMIDAAAEK